MPSFLSKVFNRKKDDRAASSTNWGSPELLGGKFEAISPNVSPTAAKFLDLDQGARDEPESFAFFRSKSRPSSPEAKPTRLLDNLPPLSLNFDNSGDKHTSNGHNIFEELDVDATLSEAAIGRRRLNPFEALVLLRACSQAITSRGLETLGIMTPHWYSASPDVQRSLISRYLLSLNTMSPTTATSSFSPQMSNFGYEVELTRSIHDVAAVFRWGLRHLQLEGDVFGTEDGWYKAFLDAEAADNYPPKAFSEKLASKLPSLHLDLLLTTLELFSSLASFSESNSTSGSKLSKIFGLWLLTARRVEDRDDWRTFYARWERTGRMLEHLFLARIRDQSTDHRMPIRLLELVRKYPYTHGLSSPTTDRQLLPRPQLTTTVHGALLVRVGYEVSSQSQIPTSKIDPAVLVADALSTKVEGEYSELWTVITAAASKAGTEAPLSNVFADETLRLLSLVGGKPKGDARSPTFSLLSLVETHRAPSPSKPHIEISPASALLSPIDLGSNWTHFSNSGFLDAAPNVLPLASTLFGTDTEKTIPPDPPASISRKSSHRISVPKKVETSVAEVPSQEPVELASPPPVPPPQQPQQSITVSGFEIIQIDEAFVDFWSDAFLDPIASNWPTFVLCKFKPTLVPYLKFGSEGQSMMLTWLVLEQIFTIKPPAPSPPPPQPILSSSAVAAADEVEQPASSVPQTPSGRRRFNFWSMSRTGSTSPTGSQKTKKTPTKVMKVNEFGELVEAEVKQDTVKLKLPGRKRKSSEGRKSKERKSESQEAAGPLDSKPSSTAPLPAVLERTAGVPVLASSVGVAAATAAIATQVVENKRDEPGLSPIEEVVATQEASPPPLPIDTVVLDSTVDGTLVVQENLLADAVSSQIPVVESQADATKVEPTDVQSPHADSAAEGAAGLDAGQNELAASISLVQDAEPTRTEAVLTHNDIVQQVPPITEESDPTVQQPINSRATIEEFAEATSSAEQTHDVSERVQAVEVELEDTIAAEESDGSVKPSVRQSTTLAGDDAVAEEQAEERELAEASERPLADEEVHVEDVIDESSVVEVHDVAETALVGQPSEDTQILDDAAGGLEPIDEGVEVSTSIVAGGGDLVVEAPSQALPEGTRDEALDAEVVAVSTQGNPELTAEVGIIVASSIGEVPPAASDEPVEQETPPITGIPEAGLEAAAEPPPAISEPQEEALADLTPSEALENVDEPVAVINTPVESAEPETTTSTTIPDSADTIIPEAAVEETPQVTPEATVPSHEDLPIVEDAIATSNIVEGSSVEESQPNVEVSDVPEEFTIDQVAAGITEIVEESSATTELILTTPVAEQVAVDESPKLDDAPTCPAVAEEAEAASAPSEDTPEEEPMESTLDVATDLEGPPVTVEPPESSETLAEPEAAADRPASADESAILDMSREPSASNQDPKVVIEDAPAAEDDAPAAEEDVPAAEEASVVEEDAPEVEEDAPEVEEEAPAAEEVGARVEAPLSMGENVVDVAIQSSVPTVSEEQISIQESLAPIDADVVTSSEVQSEVTPLEPADATALVDGDSTSEAELRSFEVPPALGEPISPAVEEQSSAPKIEEETVEEVVAQLQTELTPEVTDATEETTQNDANPVSVEHPEPVIEEESLSGGGDGDDMTASPLQEATLDVTSAAEIIVEPLSPLPLAEVVVVPQQEATDTAPPMDDEAPPEKISVAPIGVEEPDCDVVVGPADMADVKEEVILTESRAEVPNANGHTKLATDDTERTIVESPREPDIPHEKAGVDANVAPTTESSNVEST